MPQRWNRPSATPRATSRTRRGLSVRSRCRSETMRPRLVRFCCVKRRARIPPCSAGADCGDSFPGQELMRSPLSAEGICQCAKPIFTAAGHRPVSPARSLEPLSERLMSQFRQRATATHTDTSKANASSLLHRHGLTVTTRGLAEAEPNGTAGGGEPFHAVAKLLSGRAGRPPSFSKFTLPVHDRPSICFKRLGA